MTRLTNVPSFVAEYYIRDASSFVLPMNSIGTAAAGPTLVAHPAFMSKPAVVIYTSHILYPSETFIQAQAEALRDFAPYYVGTRRVPGLAVPDERTVVLNRDFLGGLREIPFKLWGFSPYLRRRLRALRPTLLHAHFGPDGLRVLPLARSLDLPLLVTFHGFDATVTTEYALRSFYSHRVYARRKDVLKREAARFIAVSNFIKEKLLAQGFPAEKVQVHYIGVDTQRFQADPLVMREPLVLFVGRLVETKGCEYLIRAMARVQADQPKYKLVIVGDGPLRANLEKLAAAALRNYEFIGVQPPEKVRAWMNRARVFCGPSLVAESGAEEAFGIVFAEAQAMGLPVVSFATGGVPEAVAHGETGFLAAEKDTDGLAAYICRLLTDAGLWQKFSDAGQKRMRDHFDLRKQTAKLEQIYHEVAGNGLLPGPPATRRPGP
ncbi:MAG: glycosyltransferase [Terriglobales bacterium]